MPASDSEVRRRPSAVTTLLWIWGVVVFVFLLTPIVTIVFYSFNNGRVLVVWDGASLSPFRRALSDPDMLASVTTSIKAALGSALLATLVGTPAAMAIARRGSRLGAAFLALIGLVLVTPEIVNGIALLIWFVRIGGPFGPVQQVVNYGLARLWVGHALYSTAVVVLVVRARLAGMDETLHEAAADLYASPARAFRQITLPLILPAVLAGFLLSFSLSMDDTIISSFVSVSGSSPWPVYVFSAVRGTLRPQVAAMATILMLLTIACLVLVAVVLRRMGGSSIAQVIAGRSK